MKTKIAVLLLLFTLFMLPGCFRTTADELYYLPRANDEYFKLQTKLDEILAMGAEYSPPTGGENRQSVQLVDIDGDGVNEVVAFFMVPAEDKPVKIYIFRVRGDEYETADVIENVGSGIESIRYIDMDADGLRELLVGWQMEQSLRHMTLYSERGFEHVAIANADYATLITADMTGDGHTNIAAVRLAKLDAPNTVEVFTLMSDGEVASSEAYFADEVESVVRVTAGNLADGVPALFLEGRLADEGVVTDIFCFKGKSLSHVNRVEHGGLQEPRLMAVYSADITGDGIIETPQIIELPRQSDMTYYGINWLAYSSDGSAALALSTYHNYSDGWYFIVPTSWRGRLTVRREDVVYGERAFVFSFLGPGGGAIHDFLKIYTLSGDNKEERAQLPGRFTLLVEGDIIYAAQLFDPGGGQPSLPTQKEITESFRRIYSDWITGT